MRNKFWSDLEAAEEGHTRTGLLEALARIGRRDDAAIDLADAALLLARLDRPQTGDAPYRAHLAQLADDVARACDRALTRSRAPGRPLSARRKAEILSSVLADDHGYNGDYLTYDDLANANLMSVIDRRKGLPISLGILYMHAARARNWTMHGLRFPGHFVIRLEGEGGREEPDSVLIDPFNNGRVVNAPDLEVLLRQLVGPAAQLHPEMIRTVTNRDILLRLQNNIKTRHLQGGQTDKAVEILERMRLLAPGNPDILMELAKLCVRAGRLRAAERAFEQCLALKDAPGVDEARLSRVKASLAAMKRHLN